MFKDDVAKQEGVTITMFSWRWGWFLGHDVTIIKVRLTSLDAWGVAKKLPDVSHVTSRRMTFPMTDVTPYDVSRDVTS